MAAALDTPSAEPVPPESRAEDAEPQAPELRRPPRAECQERSRSWWRHRNLVLRRRR